ncbi:hypothetical protein C8D88_111283 [Lentzea atacamensis]|uniref:Uncharacterized protein n=1 Tax=Lentzea atacamensis TaxID=531938 RepID=A0A316HQ75_9PSEU|nr:hypothetical protein C8D88_111283 [Lentzea atacamensis]
MMPALPGEPQVGRASRRSGVVEFTDHVLSGTLRAFKGGVEPGGALDLIGVGGHEHGVWQLRSGN